MSETLSIFIGDDPPIEEFRQFVEEHLQTPLTQMMDREGHFFEGRVSGVFVSLFDNHGLVDDCGIEFTRFRVEIDFTRFAGTETPAWNEAPFLSTVISLAKSLSHEFRSRCLVVENLQRIVRSFEPSTD